MSAARRNVHVVAADRSDGKIRQQGRHVNQMQELL
jgi:hypothetical protein